MTKRYCICVFWEKDGIVRDYFSYYLKGLQEVAEKILVVVNGKISEDSRKLLSDMGINILVRENKGLDFWAYKAGIETAGYEELSKYDELILTNCTCYGPIRPFSEMFEEMEKRDCDFWGITKHPEIKTCFRINSKKKVKIFEHIQSYFMVFKNSMFTSKDFKNYWKHLKKVHNFEEAVAYNEIIFTKYFKDKGFKDDSYIDINSHEKIIDNIMLITYRFISKMKLPLIKRKAICNDYTNNLSRRIIPESTQILKYLKNNTNYDINMIYQDILATKTMSEIKAHLGLNFVLSSEYATDSKETNKKIALIMHIYYEDLIDYCLKYAQSMPAGTDIYIVSSKQSVLDLCEEKSSLLPEYNFIYRKKNNRGRDVSAYLVTCADVFENYDYVCCMHDKKTSTQQFGITGEEFSYHCFECNLKSKNYVQNIINLLDNIPELGLLTPPTIECKLMPVIGKEIISNGDYLLKLYEGLKLDVPFDIHPVAPFGSMFWIRGKAIAPLFRHKWEYEDFPPEPLPKDGTLSHAIERIYPAIVQEAGYLTGWIMPEDYAANYINNLYYYLLQEKCRPKKISFIEKIFSLINVYNSGIKQKQLYLFGKRFFVKHFKNPFQISFDYLHFIFKLGAVKIKIKSHKITKFVDKVIKKYPDYLSIAVILKDEAADIQEWIEFHRLVGVDKFYIYDNGSLDNLKEVLQPYIKRGIVKYNYWPGKCRSFQAYNDAMKRCWMKTKWLAIIDTDEYIMPVEKDTIPEVLKDFENFGGLGINWVIFDGNDHIKKPDGTTLENYNRVRNFDSIDEHHIKSIVNPRLVKYVGNHNCIYWDNKYYTVDENKQPIGNMIPEGHWLHQFNHIKHAITQERSINKIRINHYWCKSKEEYIARLKKGFVDIQNLERVFDINRYCFKDYKYDNFAQKFVQPLKEKLSVCKENK